MSIAALAVSDYCERSAAGLWAEPLNAFSNLAFLLAAVLIAWRLWHNAPRQWDVWLLAILSAAVAIGSFLWHTLATPWSQWADVIPIGLFIAVFLLAFLRRVLRWRWRAVLAGFALFQVVNGIALASLPADALNGSVFYLPTWATLLLMTVYCRFMRKPGAQAVLGMLAIFTVSLLLRTIDPLVCPVFAAGTHFVWHLLNALLLYRAMRLLVD
jgi:hypothetical protein